MAQFLKSLHWEGYNQSLWEAVGELILHTIACLLMITLVLFYFFKTCCVKPKQFTRIKSSKRPTFKNDTSNTVTGTHTPTPTNTNTITITNSKIPNNLKTNTYKATKTNIDKRFKKYVVASLLLSLCYIGVTYYFNVISVSVLGQRPDNGCFTRNISNGLFGLQRIVVYSFYILRLNITFHNSVLEMRQRNLNILLTLIIITIISGFILIILFAYLMDSFECLNGQYYTYYFYSGVYFNCIDIAWCIILSIIYVNKLRKVVQLVTIKQKRMQYTLQKFSILAFVTVISTLLLWIFLFTALIWTYQLLSIDQIINNACIMLSFVIFDDMYTCCCCCCIKITSYTCFTIKSKHTRKDCELQINSK